MAIKKLNDSNMEPLTQPARGAAAVTQSDTTADPAGEFRALYVGGAGSIKVTLINGDTVTFTAVGGGTILPVAVSFVWSTETTATNIVGLK